MKLKIFSILLLFITQINGAQNKNCEFDYEEKTDSTYIKETQKVLIHEKIFGDSKELISFSLVNSNGIPMLNLQFIQKSSLFLPTFCFDKNSKIHFQLENGKIFTLLNFSEDNCSSLSYDDETQSNIRVISNYFFFTKENYEDLKNSAISLMRIKFMGESRDIVLKNEMSSEITNQKTNPSNYFIDYLHCIE